MLTVLEPCDSEYRVRALLLRPRQGVTSLLIGDIRVPAAASYPQFRSSFSFFLIYSLFLLPLFFSPPLPLSFSLAPYHWDLLSLASSSPPQLVCISSAGAAQEQPHISVRKGRQKRDREGREGGGGGIHRAQLMLHHERRIPTSGAVFFSHEHQCVINRINLGPNFLMIAVLMYVNECSLLTHYRQFA